MIQAKGIPVHLVPACARLIKNIFVEPIIYIYVCIYIYSKLEQRQHKEEKGSTELHLLKRKKCYNGPLIS
jgi:hypothetical protein